MTGTGGREEALIAELLGCRERLYRTALFFCRGDADRAGELLQETMLAACRSLRRFQGRSSLYTYLYRIMLNVHRSRLRRERRSPFVDPPPRYDAFAAADENPLEQMLAGERREALRKAVMALPGIYQVVILLRHLEELSYQEIADELSLPLGTVKSRLAAAREMLGRILRKDRTFWMD